MYGIYENGEVIARFVVPMTLRSNNPISFSDTLSLKRFVNKRSAQRWELEASVEPLNYSANDLMVSLITKGYSETIQITTPQNIGVISKRTISSCTATGLASSSVVTISNHSGFMPKGTFIKFANHLKVYMTTSDLSNNGTLNIYPALRTSVSSVSVANDDKVFMSCLLDTDSVRGMVFSDGILMDNGTIRFIERL